MAPGRTRSIAGGGGAEALLSPFAQHPLELMHVGMLDVADFEALDHASAFLIRGLCANGRAG